MEKEALIALIIAYANTYKVEPAVALSVVQVESRFNTEAIGKLGEIGLFQIRPEYCSSYSKEELKRPETNIMVGVKTLANYKKTCVHKNGIDWLVCYNYGPENAKKVKNPDEFPYVQKIREELDNYQQIVKKVSKRLDN